MLSLRIGIQTASLQGPLFESLKTASQLGADAIEIDARSELRPRDLTKTGLRQFRKLLDDLDLKVCAVSFPTRRGYDRLEDLDRRVDATKQAMQMAYRLGAPVVINHVGRVPDDPEADDASQADRDRWKCLTEVLDDLGHFGLRIGARLAATTGTEPAASLERLLSAAPEGSIAVNFDPGNLVSHGYSVAESLQRLGPHVASAHARDAVFDVTRNRAPHVPVGQGEVDFQELLAGLEQHEFRGCLTVVASEQDDPLTELKQAMDYLRSI
jgi:sugar phosphate isomerase/epimerase